MAGPEQLMRIYVQTLAPTRSSFQIELVDFLSMLEAECISFWTHAVPRSMPTGCVR